MPDRMKVARQLLKDVSDLKASRGSLSINYEGTTPNDLMDKSTSVSEQPPTGLWTSEG